MNSEFLKNVTLPSAVCAALGVSWSACFLLMKVMLGDSRPEAFLGISQANWEMLNVAAGLMGGGTSLAVVMVYLIAPAKHEWLTYLPALLLPMLGTAGLFVYIACNC